MMVMNVLFVFIALFVLFLTFELMLETLEAHCHLSLGVDFIDLSCVGIGVLTMNET